MQDKENRERDISAINFNQGKGKKRHEKNLFILRFTS